MIINVIEEGDITVLVLVSEFNKDDTSNLAADPSIGLVKNKMIDFVKNGARKAVIDLTEIDFLASNGMGVLVGCYKALLQVDGMLAICGLGLRLAETLSVVNLLTALPIRLTREESVAQLKRYRPGPESTKQFLRGNPSLDDIRKWWMSVAEAHGRQTKNVSAEVRRSSTPEGREEKRASQSTIASPHSPVTLSPPPAAPVDPASVLAIGNEQRKKLDDWTEALNVLKAAQTIARKYNREFSVDQTFRDFVGGIAENLINIELPKE